MTETGIFLFEELTTLPESYSVAKFASVVNKNCTSRLK